MNEIAQLRLENLVLKNIIDCISESLNELRSSDCNESGYPLFVGAVESHVGSYDSKVENALLLGYTLDYRNSAYFQNRPDGKVVRLYPASGRRETI